MNTISVFIYYDWRGLITQRMVTGSNAYYGSKYSMYYPSVYFECYAAESRVYKNASMKYLFTLFNFSSLFSFDWAFSSYYLETLSFFCKLNNMIFNKLFSLYCDFVVTKQTFKLLTVMLTPTHTVGWEEGAKHWQRFMRRRVIMTAGIVQRSVNNWWVKTIFPSRGFLLWKLSERTQVWKHPSREFNDNVVQRLHAVTQKCSFKT